MSQLWLKLKVCYILKESAGEESTLFKAIKDLMKEEKWPIFIKFLLIKQIYSKADFKSQVTLDCQSLSVANSILVTFGSTSVFS